MTMMYLAFDVLGNLRAGVLGPNRFRSAEEAVSATLGTATADLIPVPPKGSLDLFAIQGSQYALK